ncbi:FAD-binding oxidoreductase [Alphaproteobacteria bacterium 46_93_T64]|nr:FAD-binding oxidoreductase [Alphaproteobacteria bacterium 46_93_T64]
MSSNVDAIIIGAGVIGAATAFEMTKGGKKVLSIDRNPASGYGSTSGSCAIIRVHYSTFAGTVFAYEGYHYWRDWAEYLGVEDEAGLAEFRQSGCLVMQTAQNDFLKTHQTHCDALDIEYEIWDDARIRERLPIYNLEGFWPPKRQEAEGFGQSTGVAIKSGVHFPMAGFVNDPQLATHNLQRAAEAHGAEFLFQKQVVEILEKDGRVAGVRLDDGQEIYSPVVVNVAGPASSKVNAMAGVLDDMTLTTRALRQEVVHVPSPPEFDFETDGLIVSDSDISCYCRPEIGNHILIGSEDPECDAHQWVDDEDFNHNFTDQWTTQAYRYAQRVPSLGIPSRMQGVVDLYDVTEDWIPIYDKSSLPGFYMAIGSSGNQFKNAPIAGKMMAALIEYCEDGHDHDASPLQFHLPYTGHDIDVGFYSRRRQINSESSFSVLG